MGKVVFFQIKKGVIDFLFAFLFVTEDKKKCVQPKVQVHEMWIVKCLVCTGSHYGDNENSISLVWFVALHKPNWTFNYNIEAILSISSKTLCADMNSHTNVCVWTNT